MPCVADTTADINGAPENGERVKPQLEDWGRTSRIRRSYMRQLQLAEELRKEYPEVQRSYPKTISESLLDLRYVVGGAKHMSVRLNHLIRLDRTRSTQTGMQEGKETEHS